MSLREEQCNKVCRILDDVLANRPTERDSLIVAVRKAFAEPKRIRGHWTVKEGELSFWDVCSACRKMIIHRAPHYNFCPHCGAEMDGEVSEC